MASALAALFFLCVLFVQEYRHIIWLDYVTGRGSSLLNAIHAHGPATADDAALIQAWMTFDYVNHLFGLPPRYLQAGLSITDARYPHLTISRYAKDSGTSSAAFLTEVQDSARAFFAQK